MDAGVVVSPDQISIGVLVNAVPRDAVDEAVAVCGVRERRSDGKLPAHVVTYLTLGLCLFAEDDYEGVAAKVTGSLGAADLPGAPPFVPRHRVALPDDGAGTRPLAILVLSHYADTVELGRRLWEARADAVLPRDAYSDVDALVSLVLAPWLAETDSTYRDSTADRARLAVLGLAPDVRANELARIATDPHDRAVRRLLDHTDTPRMQDRPREYRSFADALRPRLAALGLRRPGWQTNGRAGASLDTVKLVLDRLTGAAHHRHRTGDPDLPTSARHLSGLANDHRTPPPRR